MASAQSTPGRRRPPPPPGDAPDPATAAELLGALGEAVVAADLNGRILYLNDAATRLFGWSREELVGGSARQLSPPGALRPHARGILVRLQHGHTWSGEVLARHQDGHVFPARLTASAVRADDGTTTGLVAVVRDMSETREARDELRRTEERLDLVRRAAPSVIWEWEIGGASIHWSDALGDTFGYTTDEIEPTWNWWRSKIHPDDQHRVGESFDRFLEEGRRSWTEEYRLRTPDRGYATVFDRAYLARDGNGEPVRVVGTLMDLTERRRHHDEKRLLSQANMILDLSLDYEASLPTIARLIVNDLADYCILEVTPGAGLPRLGTGAHANPRLQPVIEEVSEFLSGGTPAGSILERVVNQGESLFLPVVPKSVLENTFVDPRLRSLGETLAPHSVVTVPLRARGEVLGFAILGRSGNACPFDESDVRLAEDLGRRIGLAVDHARLFQSAELANRAKSDFLAVISHELRTPLTAVLGYADLLSAEIAGPLNDKQHRQVGRIKAGSDRLLRLIEGILAFARLETGRERPQMERVPVRPLVDRAREIIRPRASEKDVAFEVELGAVPDTITTDQEKFVQVLLSLLNNAVKFTPQGRVRLRVAECDGLLQLDVTDNGKGIAPEHLPYVFNPFWQAEQPATRRAGGAGLGLSVAQRLARVLRGDVLVADSSPGGTTFRFQVPIDPTA